MTIGTRIKQLRNSQDLTQEELSQMLGVSRPSIANWESGRIQPERKMVARMADIFKVSLDFLEGRPEPQKKDDRIMLVTNDELQIIKKLLLLNTVNYEAVTGMIDALLRGQKAEIIENNNKIS